MLKHLDLFSGIGGFALAAKWTGNIETIGFSEIDKYASAVLEKNFPDIPNFGDIKQLTQQSANDITFVCHVLKTINTKPLLKCITEDYLSKTSLISMESLDRLCIKYSYAELVYFALNCESVKKIISLEAESGHLIIPTIYLSELSRKVLLNGKQLVNSAVQINALKTAEAQYKLTTPTITSLLMLCGSVKDAITNGTNEIEQYLERRQNNGTCTVELITGGFP